MFKHNLIKRSVTAGLVIGAASFPAAAQAMPWGDAWLSSATANAPVVSTSSAQRQLAQLHSDLQQRFAAEGGWPSAAASVPSAPSARSGFQWDDAGVGAAGAVLLLGGGAGAGVMFRRRAHRPVTG